MTSAARFAFILRCLLVTAGAVLLLLMAGFIWQAGWATGLWPWPDGRLTYIFVGSILAAIACPIIWIGLSGELAAVRGGALNLALSFTGIAVFLVGFYHAPPNQPLHPVIVAVAAASALGNLLIYAASRGTPFRDPRIMPLPIRVSFALFAVALIGVAVALLRQHPHVFPWPLQPRTSVLIGWIFLGAAVYFLHGVLIPRWSNAAGQLLGFLAYDAVLLPPYLGHLGTVKPEHMPSLLVYLAVLIYSALLAVIYLFLNARTRLGGRGEQRD